MHIGKEAGKALDLEPSFSEYDLGCDAPFAWLGVFGAPEAGRSAHSCGK